MAVRDLVMDTDPVLRKKSREVTTFDLKLIKLLQDMKETLELHNGAGLAAPQVGILRRLAIIRAEDEAIIEFINPVIISSEGEQISKEGCLSVLDYRASLMRPMTVTVRAYDREGKEFIKTFSGYDATKCCHEFDHLDGILFYDKEIEDTEDNDIENEDEEETGQI